MPAALPPTSGHAHQQSSNQLGPIQNALLGENRSQRPSANAFPGLGNRAYFTKEYMNLLEEIKTTKVLDEAKKRIVGNRRGGGIQISGNSGESHTGQIRSTDRSEEMRAWVSFTLGDSLKLITKKLEEVDAKASVVAAEKEELVKLGAEKAVLEMAMRNKVKESSSEKRKRAMAVPVVSAAPASHARITPKNSAANARSRSSSKSRTRRVEISSDEDGDEDGVKQNLAPKLENSSDLSEVKKLLSELVQGLAGQKGKQCAVSPEPAPEPDVQNKDAEDVDLTQMPIKEEDADSDEDGLASYMKMRQDFYMSLHFSRVQELCKQRGVQYVRKDARSWELARLDLQEYVDQIKDVAPKAAAEPSRNQDNENLKDAYENGAVTGN
ncbi:hypothetical protein CBR_g31676 [Chara braunii]|uniref:Uncharacterized protein n=1 Tax=Chara braunii TaxID=69332 RepID=A0A388JY06_CHABU|nr:hypothetical protein CBR_g31676 [Chara braunii]|eukprot:GBG62657.1 hypothetical protein CBR_g31676 [Chara braunii]